MITQEHQILIERPVEEVFTYLSIPENNPQWEPMVLESRMVTNGPMRVGSKFTEKVKLIGSPIETECIVTEYEFPRIFAYKSNSSARFQTEGRVVLEPIGGSTRLSFSGKNQFGGVWRLLEPVMGGEAKKEVEGALNKLKSILEQRVPV